MSEKITVVELNNPEAALSMDRNEFYSEQVEVFKKNRETNKSMSNNRRVFIYRR